MSTGVYLIGQRASAEALAERLRNLPGVSTSEDIDDDDGLPISLNATLNRQFRRGVTAAVQALVEGDEGRVGLARELAGAVEDEIVVVDIGTGAELGRVTPGVDAGKIVQLLAGMRPIE